MNWLWVVSLFLLFSFQGSVFLFAAFSAASDILSYRFFSVKYFILYFVVVFQTISTAFDILSYHFCSVKNFFIFFWKSFFDFQSDKNGGEGGIWTLAPLLTTYPLSRRTPSTTWVLLQMLSDKKVMKLTERVGFEPTAPFGVTGFQDQLLKPLGHLSIWI